MNASPTISIGAWNRDCTGGSRGLGKNTALHLARLGEWLVSTGRLPAESFVDGRAWMRAEAVRRIADAPPAFHVAADAAALRDVSGDADLLDPSSD